MSNRAELIKKLEILISDSAATPGEKEAAKARLAAIKSKYQAMSDAEIYTRLATLTAEVKQLKLKNEELRLVKAEGVKRYKMMLKGMTDAEVNAAWRAEEKTWKVIHARSEGIRRYQKKLKTMTEAELNQAKTKACWPFDSFINAEIQRRQWRRR